MKQKSNTKRLIVALSLALVLMLAVGGLIGLESAPVANAEDTTLETMYIAGNRGPNLFYLSLAAGKLTDPAYAYNYLAYQIDATYVPKDGESYARKINIKSDLCSQNNNSLYNTASRNGGTYLCIYLENFPSSVVVGDKLVLPKGTILKAPGWTVVNTPTADKYQLAQDYIFEYKQINDSTTGWLLADESKNEVSLLGVSNENRGNNIFSVYGMDFLADYFNENETLNSTATVDIITSAGTTSGTALLLFNKSNANSTKTISKPSLRVSGLSALAVGDKVVLKKGTTVFDNFTFDRDYTFTFLGTDKTNESNTWSMDASTDNDDTAMSLSMRGSGTATNINWFTSADLSAYAKDEWIARNVPVSITSSSGTTVKYADRFQALEYSGSYSFGIYWDSTKNFSVSVGDILTFAKGTYIAGYCLDKDYQFKWDGSAWSVYVPPMEATLTGVRGGSATGIYLYGARNFQGIYSNNGRVASDVSLSRVGSDGEAKDSVTAFINFAEVNEGGTLGTKTALFVGGWEEGTIAVGDVLTLTKGTYGGVIFTNDYKFTCIESGKWSMEAIANDTTETLSLSLIGGANTILALKPTTPDNSTLVQVASETIANNVKIQIYDDSAGRVVEMYATKWLAREDLNTADARIDLEVTGIAVGDIIYLPKDMMILGYKLDKNYYFLCKDTAAPAWKLISCDGINHPADKIVGENDCVARTCSECGKTVEASATPSNHGNYEWVNTLETEHYKACSICGDIDESTRASHQTLAECDVDTDCTTQATCECNKVIAEAQAAHAPASSWSSDANGHWHACTNANCAQKADSVVGHTPNDDDGDCTTAIVCSECNYVTTAGNSAHDYEYENLVYKQIDNEGTKQHQIKCEHCNVYGTAVDCSGGTATCIAYAKCSACGKDYGAKLAHAAAPDAEWVKTDADDHWKICATEGCSEVVEKATHDWNDGEETLAPTEDAVGTMTYTCTVCLATKTAEIPKLNHVHVYQLVEAVAPTCTDNGTIEHYICSGENACSLKFTRSGEEGSYVYTQVSSIVDPAKGHTYGDLVPAKSATCSAKGNVAYYQCSVCELYFDESKAQKAWTELELAIDEDAHSYGEWQAQVNATCTETGTKAHYTCSICSKHFDGQNVQIQDLTISALGHTYGTEIAKVDATCETAGKLAYYKCSVCDKLFVKDGENYVEKQESDLVIEALGHTYGTEIAEVEATCDTEGVLAHYECSVCEKLFVKDGENYVEKQPSDIVIDALGHDFGENDAEKFCQREGCDFRKNYTADDLDEILALEGLTKYDYSDSKPIDGNSTLGQINRTFDKDDEGENTTAISNDFIINSIKNEDGTYSYVTGKESTHNMLVSFSLNISDWATNTQSASRSHYVWLNGHENGSWGIGFQFCFYQGAQNLRVVYKSVDGKEVRFIEPVSLAGFELNKTQTFQLGVVQNSDGSYFVFAYYNGKLLLSGELTTETLATYANADTHNGLGGAVAFRFNGSQSALCVTGTICDLEHSIEGTQHACKDYQCKICGSAIAHTAEHTWGDGVKTGEGSCTVKEIYTRTCAVCADTTTYEGNFVHEWDKENPVIVTPASCGGVDRVEKYNCKHCDVQSDEVTIDGSGPDGAHDYVYVDVTPATCIAGGTEQGTCSKCGHKTEISETPIDKKAHSYGSEIAKVDATCTTNGSIAHYKCAHCEKLYIKDGETYVETTASDLVILAGHDYQLVAKVDATCTTDGNVAHYKCSVCEKLYLKEGDNYVETTANDVKILAGHDYQLVAKVDATCAVDGAKEHYKCSACDKLFVKDGEAYVEVTANDLVIKAGHSYQFVEATVATCATDGNVAHYKCSVCEKLYLKEGDNYVEANASDIVVKAEHKYQFVEATEATCSVDGNVAHYKCSVCEKLYLKEGEIYTETTLADVTLVAGHSFVEGVCSVCQSKDNLYFFNQAMQDVTSATTSQAKFDALKVAIEKYNLLSADDKADCKSALDAQISAYNAIANQANQTHNGQADIVATILGWVASAVALAVVALVLKRTIR